MNKLIFGFAIGATLLGTVACKKENDIGSNNTATIQVINGIIREDVQLKMNGNFNLSGANSSSSQASTVPYAAGTFYYTERRSTPVEILKNTTTSLFSDTYDFKGGSIYTMLLAGVSPNVEPVIIDDTNIPKVDLSKIPSDDDSIIYIRFINLAPDTQPLDIRLAGATANEVSGLAYKGYTVFKAYPARNVFYFGTFGYDILDFEVLQNGTVLQTYSMFLFEPYNRYNNVALVITGKKNPNLGEPGLMVSEVNYFQ